MSAGTKRKWSVRLGVVFVLLAGCATGAFAQQAMRILLTNDDGIGEVQARLLPVAERLREFAEVYVVVPDQDRSGTSNILGSNQSASLESRLVLRSEATEKRHLLEVHAVDGYPADCVVLGVYGLLKGQTVDLVVSGPNGGPNLADSWFVSGTIGAARTAAYMGLPAVAVSGLDSSQPDQVAALAEWISALARSRAVRDMEPLTYLTVAVPRMPPDQIRGVRIAPRAHVLSGFDVNRVADVETGAGAASIWTLRTTTNSDLARSGEDVPLYLEKWIVVTPMIVDERVDREGHAKRDLSHLLPPWRGR